MLVSPDGLQLWSHLARPDSAAMATGSGGRRGLVLAHGFPTGSRWSETAGRTYPEFADRLAAEAGWTVLAFNFRGTGQSPGDFSLSGWVADLRAAVELLSSDPSVDGVWLAGFRTGGALAICAAADDPRVRGVATFGAPADFADWSSDPRAFLERCRSLGAVRSRSFPEDFDSWAQELKEIRSISRIAEVPPRPLMIVHGSDDDVVPLSDARVLVDTTENQAELRVITGAGHRLRHDPRGVAVLLGWLDRQSL